jgi:predicted metal-binding protein
MAVESVAAKGEESLNAEKILAEAARLAARAGVTATGQADVSSIVFRPEFRKLCEANRCGCYDQGWMCPPAVGDIEALASELRKRSKALVFSLTSNISASFDYRGMAAAGGSFAKLVGRLSKDVGASLPERCSALVLGAGPCRVCERCAYLDKQPCRHPESAVMSLEANGVDVSQLAKLAGLKYNSGPGTVTYFGAIFLNP